MTATYHCHICNWHGDNPIEGNLDDWEEEGAMYERCPVCNHVVHADDDWNAKPTPKPKKKL